MTARTAHLCLTHRVAYGVGNIIGTVLGVALIVFGAPAHRLCTWLLGEGWDQP